MSYARRKKHFKSKPWLRCLEGPCQRCTPSGDYYEKGRRNYLTVAAVKFLWHRDKAWLLDRPSIDRINNDGNCTIENCRFIELKEQINQGATIRKRKVAQYDLRGNLIKIYDSLTDAAKAHGKFNEKYKSSEGLTAACKGQYKTLWGYTWKYV